MRILSFLTDPPVVKKILEHLESARADTISEGMRSLSPS